MAIGVSAQTSGVFGSTATVTTASISPPANSLILISFFYHTVGTPADPAGVTGNGITYTKITGGDPFSGNAFYVYYGMSSSPTSGPITITATNLDTPPDSWMVHVVAFTGVSQSGVNGSGAIGNHTSNGAGSSIYMSTTITCAAGNAAYGFAWAGNTGQTMTQGAGFSLIGSPLDDGIGRQTLVEYNLAGPTTVDFSYSPTPSTLVIYGFEIVAFVPVMEAYNVAWSSMGTTLIRSLRSIAMASGMIPDTRIATIGAVAPPATTFYYVDADWAGAHTGQSSAPWNSLADTGAWTTVNAALSAGPVTVYHAARKASSDVNQTTAQQIVLSRTDASTNRLTLDGMSFYNTSEVTPSWVTYSGNSRHAITCTNNAVGTNNFNGAGGPWPDRNYITVRGFILNSNQTVILGGVHQFVLEYCDVSAPVGAVNGPGILVCIPYQLNNGTTGGSFPTQVTIRNNTVHDTFGEGIYLGATTPDPPLSGGLPGTRQGSDSVLIQGNTITNPGRNGGQGDGIDIKDGNTNVSVIGNVITYPLLNPSTGLYDNGHGPDANGIIVESCALIDGNYVENPSHSCIAPAAAWDNATGRTGLIIRNNICLPGDGSGAVIFAASSATYQWTNTAMYNNTVYNAGYAGFGAQTPSTGLICENNIVHTTGSGFGVDFQSGTVSTHDYNCFQNVAFPLHIAGVNTDCTGLAAVEPHSQCADPLFVNTSAPHSAANFKLQGGSPAATAGTDLSSIFTDDFGNQTRTAPWSEGAWKA